MTDQYDVFISYRHLPADKAAAIRLEKLLERHKKKDGKRLRVFRDQSELPTSSDLDADIREALENSRYLVVICSPTYRDSKWCMRELQYFRQLHDNRNTYILPLLVEGDPQEVFPQELCWEQRQITAADGSAQTVTVEIEPLCANICADSNAKRMRLLRTEYLRIAAPVLGVTFDSLYRRAQRRKWAAAAVAAAAVAAFGVYNAAMLSQIRQRQQQMYESQSLRLANEALPLIAQDPELAILLADAALPENLQRPDYAILPEAELALRSAALQRSIELQTSPFQLQTRIPLTSSHWEVGSACHGGQWLPISDHSSTSLYDLTTGDLLSATDYPLLLFQDSAYGVYYIADGSRCLLVDSVFHFGVSTLYCYDYCDSLTGQVLGSYEVELREDTLQVATWYFPLYDGQTGLCHIICREKPGGKVQYRSVGYFDQNGVFTEKNDPSIAPLAAADDPYLRSMGSFSELGLDLMYEYGDYPRRLQEAPQDYQAAMEAFSAGYGQDWSVQEISRTADGRMYVMHIRSAKIDLYANPALQWEGTAFWDAQENRLMALWEDCCLFDPAQNLLIRVTDDAMLVYRLDTRLCGGSLLQEQSYEFIASDGSWVLDLEDDFRDYKNFGPMEVLLATDMGSPILQAQAESVYVSKNEDYIAYSTENPQGGYILHVYCVSQQRETFRLESEEWSFYTLAVNEDGSRVAWGSNYTLVADTATGQILARYQLEFSDLYTGAAHLEFSGSRLLILRDNDAYVCDVDSGAEPMHLRCGAASSGMYGGFLGDLCFTSDGLVLLPSDGIMVMGNPTPVTAIYDLETGNEVSFFSTYSDYGQNFLYDDATGTLIIQQANRFYAQRRGEDGNFQVVYTITPKATDMTVNTFAASCDGRYLVLNSSRQCEIYDLADGSLRYVLTNALFATSHYGVADGVLYDLRAGQTGQLLSYPLPDTRQARELARKLVSRSLTAQEREAYYVPTQWGEAEM